MKIVITGGLGFIAQNLAIHLRSQSDHFHLTAIDHFTEASDQEKSLFDQVHHSCFSDPSALAIVNDADVLVHLAADTTVQQSISNPTGTFENNVVRTHVLLEHVRLNAPDVKIIFASTGGAIIGDYDGAINETVVARPLSPYGASKLAVEGMLSAYQGAFGIKSASLRFSNVYGPNSHRKGSVIAAFCKMVRETNTLQINGDGKQTRDYIYVDDIARAIHQVIRQDGLGVFQLGTGTGTSILTITDIFREILQTSPPNLTHAAALTGEVRHNRCDISRISTELGFTPEWTLEAGIRKTAQWYNLI